MGLKRLKRLKKLNGLVFGITSCLFLTALFSSHVCSSQSLRIGLSAGPESIMSIPRVGLEYPLITKGDFEISAAADVGVWWLFTLWYNASLDVNFRYKKFAVEPCVGFWQHKVKEFDINDKHLTFTPKIGMDFKYWGFRIGPSYRFWTDYRDDDYDDWELSHFTDINSIPMNFDVRIRIPWSELTGEVK